VVSYFSGKKSEYLPKKQSRICKNRADGVCQENWITGQKFLNRWNGRQRRKRTSLKKSLSASSKGPPQEKGFEMTVAEGGGGRRARDAGRKEGSKRNVTAARKSYKACS